jgi:hypothetical protein
MWTACSRSRWIRRWTRLELDAGSIVLFEQEEGPTTQTEVDLVLKASAQPVA